MKVAEIFVSIQGEGIWTGIPMVFVRTAGCNLRCRWCDTRHAWDEEMAHRWFDIDAEEIATRVRDMPTRWVCITGGEPLLQKEVYQLIELLYRPVVIETNGSLPVNRLLEYKNVNISMDIKTPSSGMQDSNLFENVELLRPMDQLKFVIADQRDFEYAKDVLSKYRCRCEVIFQPVWGKMAEELARWVIEDRLQVRVMLQSHKYMFRDESKLLSDLLTR